MDIGIAGGDAVTRTGLRPREVASIRLGGWAAVVGGILMVGHEVADLVIGGRTTDAPRALLHTAWLTALFLAVRGFGVLLRRRHDRVGRGLVRVALVGVGAQAILAGVEAAARKANLVTRPAVPMETPLALADAELRRDGAALPAVRFSACDAAARGGVKAWVHDVAYSRRGG